MNIKNFLFSSLLVACAAFIHAQQTTLVCGFDHFMKMKKTHNPEYSQGYDELFRRWKSEKDSRGGGGGVYNLPVVFHVVYNLDSENIPDSVVISQVMVLNEDYRRLNEDAINTRDIFLPFAGDTEIEFHLAETDPEGNPTNGITHTYTDRSSFDLDLFAAENTLDEVKHVETGGVNAWDPSHYINIWICNIGESFIGQIFGLSYPPEGLENWPAGSSASSAENEGVIIHYTTVGRNNPFADEDGTDLNNKGRTLTHEMGHYLGLRHTWGDEFFTDICSEDDGIDDTPICGSGDQYSCDYQVNSCDDGTSEDLPDMLENYMDYTKDECYNMFTNEQKSLMRYVLENLRNSLLGSVSVAERTSPGAQFNIWPNPTNSMLQFTFDDSENVYTYSIKNLVGCELLNGSLNNHMIDLHGLPSGQYFITLMNEDSSTTQRFILN